MKGWILGLLILLLTAAPLAAIEFQWKDDKGNRVFKCTAAGAGGVAKVKIVGKNKYLVFGGAMKGIVVPAYSYAQAARITCGEEQTPGK